jgi:hypothetical protein
VKIGMGSWERGGCCCCTKGWVGGCAVDPFRGCLIDRIIVGGDGWGGGGGGVPLIIHSEGA